MHNRILLIALIIVNTASLSYTQKYSKGHPGYKKQQRKKTKRFAKRTERAVKKMQKKHEGIFPLEYRKGLFKNKSLDLKLVKVHKKKFYKMNDSIAFICADFLDKDSVLYDVDVFMKKPKGAKKYKVISNRMIHKVNHYPVFSWYKDNGEWNRCRIRDAKFIDKVKKGKTAPLSKKNKKPPKKHIRSKVLSKIIRKKIKKEQKKNKGYYTIDPEGHKKPVKLKLKKVHKNDHFTVNDSIAAICVDFADKEGRKCDVDVWVARNKGKYNKIIKQHIHKYEKKPLYAWYNDAGSWKKCNIRSFEEARAEGK
ncbi:MAG: hypothetical protein ABEH43_02715 [Flavobacteriales bacterium]